MSVRGGFNDLVQKNLCVTWSTPVRPCDPPSPAASFPMCNLTAPVATRVADLVSRLPPATVPHLLVNMAPSVDSLWLQPQNWWSEALHGVQSGCANTAQGSRCPVSFPAAISTAASFNKTLFEAVGNVIGTEARALSNIGVADGFTFWCLCRARIAALSFFVLLWRGPDPHMHPPTHVLTLTPPYPHSDNQDAQHQYLQR